MQLKTIYSHSKDLLNTAHCASAALDARLLICHILNYSHEDFILRADHILNEKQIAKIEQLIAQRASRIPVAKLIGYKEFYGRTFITNDHTLDPRPDSEIVIDSVLSLTGKDKPFHFIDLGTGTGCLGLTLACENKNCTGLLVDNSASALAVATKNRDLLHCSDRVALVESDWWQNVPNVQKFDVIISNPPYITTQDYADLDADEKHDPYSALVGGTDGLEAYRIIIQGLQPFCHDETIIAFEIGQHQEQDITHLLHDFGLKNTHYHRDLSGIIRVVMAYPKKVLHT
jgi:release factor glutamine methyltransferase